LLLPLIGRTIVATLHTKEVAVATQTLPQSASVILEPMSGLLPDLEALYKDVHSHPETVEWFRDPVNRDLYRATIYNR
jgi:hypothetical protein